MVKKQSYLHLGTNQSGRVVFVKVSAYGEKPTKTVWDKFIRTVKGADTLHSLPVMLQNRQTKPFNKFKDAVANIILLDAIRREYSK